MSVSSALVVRPFRPEDAPAAAGVVRRNLIEVNSRDYPLEEMVEYAATYGEEKLLGMARDGHSYTLLLDSRVVGCGTIAPRPQDGPDTAILLGIYVLPDLHGAGAGRRIVEALEADEYFRTAKRVIIHASLTAHAFYHHLGYAYVTGEIVPEDGGYYLMEKRPKGV